MDPPSKPLEIQELVDHCIDFLHDSRRDLKRCALVCRAWLYPAQFHLFRNWTFLDTAADQHRRVAQLDRMPMSPGVLRLVVRLQAQLQYVYRPQFSAFLPQFTKLQELRIGGVYLPSSSTYWMSMMTVKRLLSIPSIQRVELYCTFHHLAPFLRLWEGCSDNIQHLALGRVIITGRADDWVIPSSLVRRTSRIRLETLVISYGAFIRRWVAADACPFDFSRLTKLTLRMVEHVGAFKWGPLSGSLATIEELDLTMIQQMPRAGPPPHIDLSQFKRLRILALRSFDSETTVNILDTLSTVHPHNRILISRISLFPSLLTIEALTRLDTLLTTLPLLELVEVKLGWAWTSEVYRLTVAEDYLPLLRSRYLLTVVETRGSDLN
ncbi:hypothetical protein FB45DRAFT_522677 [Roridomyces roridus]|uniref:F-box domain-containing protein n=1 Tax=Roridomyces roridus TaxID=1738132 RepID=A0AAD7FR11_9AGAR|nr:hypothetical protein FB45DRAFT_522677 [Roridomyces roridus]